MVACLPLLSILSLGPQAAPAQPIHKIEIHIAGPLAMVETWRTVEVGLHSVGNRQTESPVDLKLPEKAALVDWEIVDRGERARMAEQGEGQVSAGLTAALKLRHISPSTVPVDDGTDYRIHITPLAEGAKPVLHYRYAMPVGCSDGKLIIRMPESLEENPVPAEVTVTLQSHPDGYAVAQASLAGRPAEVRRNTRRLVMHGLSPARAAWDVSWSYARTLPGFPGQALLAAALVAKKMRAKPSTDAEVLTLACLEPRAANTATPASLPSTAILLVDRSRSVGQGGLSEERVFARAFLEALPPSVPFNAILFGETATPLFPVPRMATREALDAFSNAADPNRLERTTDVAGALARVRKTSLPGSDGQTWIVLVTDGALPASQTTERMFEALSGIAERNTRVLVLLVRQRGDDSVGSAARAQYVRLAEKVGGLIREVPSGSADETARAVVSAMANGGDWFGLRFGDLKLADALPAGHGATATGKLGFRRHLRFTARGTGLLARQEMATVSVDTAASVVRREWLAPLMSAARPRAWAGATASVAVAVLPASPLPKKEADGIVHGRIDETVLRNALSLAFMPRARACYLARRVATPNDAFLRGRVRLELTIERGELLDAVVRKSTLNKPEIEACLRNAAWAVDYPRPEHRDALTVANLNLVFRPRSPEEIRPDASALDREIELILGPLTFTADFSDLLEDGAAEKSGAP